jgi:hypothetical protein
MEDKTFEDKINKGKNFIMGLDVSTKTIGVSLFEDKGRKGELKLLHHIAPKVKPKVESKMEELFIKSNIFRDEFLMKYTDIGIKKIIIEEPLLGSNNVNTVATLLRFNGMVSKACYDLLGIVPEFISSYDARAYGFPELMQKRTEDKKGNRFTPAAIAKKDPVLFGGYAYDIDKKEVIWKKVFDLEPQIIWLYDKNKVLMKENYDMTDAYAAVMGKMRKDGLWD